MREILKYEEIYQDLESKIIKGQYKPNERLPLEKEMCLSYGVSKITIRKAMDKLVMNGLVVKKRGSGSFVNGINKKQVEDVSTSLQFTGFSKTYNHENISTKILRFQVINPNDEVANKLNIDKESFVYDICRVRYIDKEPYVIEYTYMPVEVIPGIKKDILNNSIYSYIEDQLHLKIKSAYRVIRALVPTELEKENLNITNEIPILEVEQVAFLDSGIAYEYSKSHHRSDKFEFRSISMR